MQTIKNDDTPKKDQKSNWMQKLVGLGKALNHDFCPDYNKYVYWIKKPFGWMVIAIPACGLVGLLVAPQGYVLMWSLIAVLIIGVTWPWVSMRGISCSITFRQQRIEEGKPATAILKIVNHWPIPVFGLTLGR